MTLSAWVVVAAIAATGLGGCTERARYEVAATAPPILVDTTSGETWRLIYDEGNNPMWVAIKRENAPLPAPR